MMLSTREAAWRELLNGEKTRDCGQTALSLRSSECYSLPEGKTELPKPLLRICPSEIAMQVHKDTYCMHGLQGPGRETTQIQIKRGDVRHGFVRVLVSAQNVGWKNANMKSGDTGKSRSAGFFPTDVSCLAYSAEGNQSLFQKPIHVSLPHCLCIWLLF